MNIFVLHPLPTIAAEYHCDKHVGKMLIESCQMLSTAHHHFGNKVTYKPTHVNHPCNVWVRKSQIHYSWLSGLANALGRQFTMRYGKVHKSTLVYHKELYYPPAQLIALPWISEKPPLAMPDEFKSNDVIESYRKYYLSKRDKMVLAWNKGTNCPEWALN